MLPILVLETWTLIHFMVERMVNTLASVLLRYLIFCDARCNFLWNRTIWCVHPKIFQVPNSQKYRYWITVAWTAETLTNICVSHWYKYIIKHVSLTPLCKGTDVGDFTLRHADLIHVEISTEMYTCLTCRCTLQWRSQQPIILPMLVLER